MIGRSWRSSRGSGRTWRATVLRERPRACAQESGVRRRPRAAHQDRVGLDRECAAALGDGQELDQVRVQVQLLADFAKARRQCEEEFFTAIVETKGRVETRVEKLPIADRASTTQTSHAGMLGTMWCTPTRPSRTGSDQPRSYSVVAGYCPRSSSGASAHSRSS